MKPADITPGVVYGYKPGKYDPLRPVLIVEASYWRRHSTRFGSTETRVFYSLDDYDAARRETHATARPMPRGYSGSDVGPDCGLPGVDFRTTRGGIGHRNRDRRDADAKALTALARRGLPLLREKFLAAENGEVHLDRPKDARLHLFNPAWVLGEWAEVYGAEQDEQARRATVEAEAKAESDARIAQATKRVEALRGLGLPGDIDDPAEHRAWRTSGDWVPPRYSGSTGYVKLSMRQVDALLSLIPDGAVWREDDVEEDGWTLLKPEYAGEAPDDDEDVGQ